MSLTFYMHFWHGQVAVYAYFLTYKLFNWHIYLLLILLLFSLHCMIILILISVVLCVIPGILVLTKVEKGGLGASLNAVFKCNSCTLQTVNFQRLALVDGSKRTVMGLAPGEAFFISNLALPNPWNKLFFQKQVLWHHQPCLPTYHLNTRWNVRRGKGRMKETDANVLERPVITTDGVWHTSLKMVLLLLRTKHWRLFWYGHKCMQGKDDIIEEPLYAGSVKSIVTWDQAQF